MFGFLILLFVIVVSVVVSACAVAVFCVYTYQGRFYLYFPPNISKRFLKSYGYSEQVKIVFGKMTTWPRIAALKYMHGFPRTIVYFHGNATNVHQMTVMRNFFVNTLRCNVVFVEYPGYDKMFCENPTQGSIVRQAIRVLDCLTPAERNSKLIFYGESLGAAAALHTLWAYGEDNVGGIVLHNPFVSVPHMARKFGVPAFFTAFIKDKWRNDKVIRYIKTPVLILSATRDEVIPSNHRDYLYRICSSEDKKIIEFDGRHNDRISQECVEALREFCQ